MTKGALTKSGVALIKGLIIYGVNCQMVVGDLWLLREMLLTDSGMKAPLSSKAMDP